MLLLLSTVSGCGRYYVLESNLIQFDSAQKSPEITLTKAYNNFKDKRLKVALRAPDTCVDEGASRKKGTAQFQEEIMRTSCGVEMSEIERALVKEGFQVSSWKAVQNIVRYSNVTPIIAAKQLGAEIMFQINSLEKTTTDTGGSAKWERKYYNSNAYAEILSPAKVGGRLEMSFNDVLTGVEKGILTGRLSFTVNATAVDVATGETIWFYDWTLADKKKRIVKQTVLVGCSKGRCTLRRPRNAPSPQDCLPGEDCSDSPKSGRTYAVVFKDKNADDTSASYHKLMRHVIANLVKAFVSGRTTSI